MRLSMLAAVLGVGLLAGCTHHGMDHGAMSQEEMMRHCQMMAEHHGAQAPAHYDPAHHGGMSYEEFRAHCEAMRSESPPPHPH
ncbi:hypothetical protein [Terricaulis sp.]|uniref:hypothetical protein n=1 Tax=Terricaulis sp. TaxID=2768686 RepID=UPI0037852E12